VLVDREVVLRLLLVVLGSGKFSSTVREVGRFRGGTRRTLEEAKSDLISEEVKEAREATKDLKSEALDGAQQNNERRKP
jgi:Sec-independent protein translocase protein TatA